MVEFLLCLFFGMFGVHKFYNKNIKMGIIYLCTLGLFGLGWIYDTIKLGMELIKGHTSSEQYESKRLAKEEARLKAKEERELAVAEEKERISAMDREGIAYCPKCKSSSIQYVERRKQLSLGRAAVGTVLINPLAGAVGAVTSKKHKGFVKCLKCGHSWKI